MVKPRLPIEIEELYYLPHEIVRLIHSFVPHLPKRKDRSPSYDRELIHIQKKKHKTASPMYLKDLDDFVLD
jgi:hypothetical protein